MTASLRGRFQDAAMLKNEVPLALSPTCFIHHVFIDAWHHSLSTMIRKASRQFGERIISHYRSDDISGEYRVFSGFGDGYWMIGVGIEIPVDLCKQFPSLIVSNRLIERRHCPDNITMIIEYELGKMPVGRINGHLTRKLTVTCNV